MRVGDLRPWWIQFWGVAGIKGPVTSAQGTGGRGFPGKDRTMTEIPDDSATTTRPADAARPAPHELEALRGKSVCPFCGEVREQESKECPRCAMEDTPATRQATRLRIGPWFVLQSRNPSAPGMKWSTLLALVQRGQITPRSVVRGPTTHQLWTFAARVRGLSRELGLCHNCNAEIEPTANICPSCNKLQEPPVNPDQLLEPRDAPRAPVTREIRPLDPSTPVAAAPSRAGASSPGSTRSEPASALPVPATPLQRARPMPPPSDDGILSARELAAAFQLELVPPRPPKPILKPILLTLAGFLVLTGLVALWARDDWRRSAVAWFGSMFEAVSSRIDTRAPQQNPVPSEPAISAPEPRPALPPPVAPPQQPAATEAAPEPRPEAAPPPAAPVQTPGGDPLLVSRTLYRQAIDAESRQNPHEALRLYEQIQQLPPSVWPGDLQIRIDQVRRQIGP